MTPPPARPAPPVLDLDAVRARLDAITAPMVFEISRVGIIKVYAPSAVPYKANGLTEADKIFLEHAPSDIRALVAEIEYLRRENENLFQHLSDDDQDYFRKEFGYVWQRR